MQEWTYGIASRVPLILSIFIFWYLPPGDRSAGGTEIVAEAAGMNHILPSAALLEHDALAPIFYIWLVTLYRSHPVYEIEMALIGNLLFRKFSPNRTMR